MKRTENCLGLPLFWGLNYMVGNTFSGTVSMTRSPYMFITWEEDERQLAMEGAAWVQGFPMQRAPNTLLPESLFRLFLYHFSPGHWASSVHTRSPSHPWSAHAAYRTLGSPSPWHCLASAGMTGSAAVPGPFWVGQRWNHTRDDGAGTHRNTHYSLE